VRYALVALLVLAGTLAAGGRRVPSPPPPRRRPAPVPDSAGSSPSWRPLAALPWLSPAD